MPIVLLSLLDTDPHLGSKCFTAIALWPVLSATQQGKRSRSEQADKWKGNEKKPNQMKQYHKIGA